MSNSVGGLIAQPKGRPPKTHPIDRHCVRPGCQTKLSLYNGDQYCYLHQPIKRPRLRGRMPSEVMEAEEKPSSRCHSCAQRNRYKRKKLGRDIPEVLIDGVVHREGTGGRATLCEDS